MVAQIVALIVAVAGCKTRGTIEVEFAPAAMACAPEANAAIVYAVPNVTCADSACACGGCFGLDGGVDGCPDGLCSPDLGGVELDLAPGHWAVVLALLHDDDDPTLPGGAVEVGYACVDIDVDADGTADGHPEPGQIACETCAPP